TRCAVGGLGVVAGLHGGVEPGIALIQLGVHRFDDQCSALRHGIACVHSKIHDHLLDLARVSLHCAQLGAGDHHQLNVFTNHTVQHLEIFCDHSVEVDDPGGKHLLAAEGK